MDRRLLFPAVAITAWAQQTNPAAAKAEKALRARVEQFYQLQQDKKYRQAEELIASDTKDYYYSSAKADIRSFQIQKIELMDRNREARVTVKVGQVILFPGAGAQIMELPATTTWKLEKGKWSWYVDREALKNTPFGRMKGGDGPVADKLDRTGEAPSLAELMNQVMIDRASVELTDKEPSQTVTITSNLPGLVELKLDPHAETIKGLTVEFSKTQLNQGEKSVISFRAGQGARFSDVVRINALPMNKPFDVQVTAK
jgi:hypothetical protein